MLERRSYLNWNYRYLISIILFWRLLEKVDIVPPSLKHLQFGRFIKNGKDFLAFVNYKFSSFQLSTKRVPYL